jgi:AcrR family transcriptional regulator
LVKKTAIETRGPGRPRSQRARKSILQSTLQLLQKTGFIDLSIEAIAAKAGVGKATVYRWWPNKAELVMEAFLLSVEEELKISTTGSAEKVIREQMTRWTRIFRSPLGRVIAAVIGAGQSDPAMLGAFQRQYVEPRRTEARKLLRVAMRKGEIRSTVEPDTILDILYGPLYMRLLLQHAALDSDLPQQVFDIVMPGLRPRPDRP